MLNLNLDKIPPFLYESTWSYFYDSVKGGNWPDCINEHEFHSLPEFVKKEIIEVYNGQQWLKLTDEDVTLCPLDIEFKAIESPGKLLLSTNALDNDYHGEVICNKRFKIAKDFSVYFNESMFGFGTYHCHHLPKMLKYLYPSRYFNDCLEWCSGPGFIGFRLMSDELMNSLTMLEINLPCLIACIKTWNHRPDRLQKKKMHIVHSSNVSKLKDKQFDLIVGNPPNFNYTEDLPADVTRRVIDKNYAAHTDFFLNIKKNLKPDGVILLLKGRGGSNPSDHISAIEQGGLKLNRVLIDRNCPQLYYLEILHR